MSLISLPFLPRPAAEEALVSLWLFLAERRLPTPKINIEFESNDRVLLSVAAGLEDEAAVFRNWAKEWCLRAPHN